MKEVSSDNTGFSIGKHSFNATRSSISEFQALILIALLPEILDITFPVIKQKSTDQLLLQECALECALYLFYTKNHSNSFPTPAKYHSEYHPDVQDLQIFLLGLV